MVTISARNHHPGISLNQTWTQPFQFKQGIHLLTHLKKYFLSFLCVCVRALSFETALEHW